jgi:hypothetical protein
MHGLQMHDRTFERAACVAFDYNRIGVAFDHYVFLAHQ